MSMCCRPKPISALMLALSAATPAMSGEPAGLSVVFHGGVDDAAQDRVARAAMDALPEALLDPQRNFTTHPAYDPERTYRMVLVFHDPAWPVEADLCAGNAEEKPSAIRPADFEGLETGVGLTGALCVDNAVLRQASLHSAGRVSPDQISFRFLVADTAKALFPDGFSRLPRRANNLP